MARDSLFDEGPEEVRLRKRIVIVDENGDVRVRLGRLTAAGGSGGAWGLEIVNQPGTNDWPGGEPYFRSSDDGAEFPYQTLPAINDTEVINVTSGSFTKTWTAATGILMHKYASATTVVSTPSGTTGEIRLSIDVGGSTQVNSAAVTIPSASSGYFTVPAFAHGLDLWSGPHYFEIQARRTGGAGNVSVYQPALGVVLTPR